MSTEPRNMKILLEEARWGLVDVDAPMRITKTITRLLTALSMSDSDELHGSLIVTITPESNETFQLSVAESKHKRKGITRPPRTCIISLDDVIELANAYRASENLPLLDAPITASPPTPPPAPSTFLNTSLEKLEDISKKIDKGNSSDIKETKERDETLSSDVKSNPDEISQKDIHYVYQKAKTEQLPSTEKNSSISDLEASPKEPSKDNSPRGVC